MQSDADRRLDREIREIESRLLERNKRLQDINKEISDKLHRTELRLK